MLRLSIFALIVATSLAGCDSAPTPQPSPKGWQYQQTEDRLRQTTVSSAQLLSEERWGMPPEERPLMVMTITKGSADNDAVVLVSSLLSCGYSTLIRVDDHPIEGLPCPASGRFFVRLPLDTDLAKHIVASKEVVIETPEGLRKRQVTFKTEGLDLTKG